VCVCACVHIEKRNRILNVSYFVYIKVIGLLVWVRTEVIDAPQNDNIRGYISSRGFI
jgi:hypothetical protein